MALIAGRNNKVIEERTTGAGQAIYDDLISKDTLQIMLQVESVTSGNLNVSVYSVANTGTTLLFQLPQVSAGQSNVTLKGAGTPASRFRVIVTYTGTCSYAVYARNIDRVSADTSLEDKTLSNAVFAVTTNDITSGAASTENPQLLIRNTSTTRKMRIYQILTSTCVSTNNNIFRFYMSPQVVSNGAALTPVCLHNPGGVSQMSISTVPTIFSNGSRFLSYNQGATSTDILPFPHKIILEPGYSMLTTVRPNAASVTFSLNILWVEE